MSAPALEGSRIGIEATIAVRIGIEAAQVARSVEPRRRNAEDLSHLMQLARSRNCYFANYSDEVLLEVCQALQYHPMLANKTIFKEGSPATHVYLIASGRVSLRSETTERLAPHDPARKHESGNEDCLDMDPDNPTFSRSRGTFHKRRHALRGKLQASETAPQKDEKKEREEIVASAMTKVRNVVASLKLARMGSTISGQTLQGDTPASFPSSPTKHRKTNPAGRAEADTRKRVAINRPGRLDDSLVGVIKELASRSLGVDSAQPQVFNRCFQDFADRMEAKVQSQVEAAIDHVEAEPFVQFNPNYLAECVSADMTTTGEQELPEVTPMHGKTDNDDITHVAPSLDSEVQVGYVLGASACMSRKPYDATAKALELCELLSLPVEAFNAAVAKERARRRQKRETKLLEAIPGLRDLDKERVQRLVESFRSIHHRRGAVLCYEGEVRVPHDEDDRLQVIFEGCVRTVKARTETPQIDIRGRKEHIPLQRDVGSLLPGQIVNGHSQLFGVPEPFTAIAESADVIVMSATHSDLVRIGGSGLLESLRLASEELNAMREERLGKKLEVEKPENHPDKTHARLAKWLLEGESVAPMGVPHAYVSKDMANMRMSITQTPRSLTRRVPLRGGPNRVRHTAQTARRSFAASSSPPLRPLVPRGHTAPSTENKRSPRGQGNRERHKRVSVTDTIFLDVDLVGLHDGRPQSTLLRDNDLPDDHFAQAPNMSPFVSQLLIGDSRMRFPRFPRLERLEARGAQATIVGVTPTDPFHIATIDYDPFEQHAADIRVSTAPAKLNLTESSCGDFATPHIAQTAPLTPRLPKLQPDRRWKAMQKKCASSTSSQKCPEEGDQMNSAKSSEFDGLHRNEHIDMIEWQNGQFEDFISWQDTPNENANWNTDGTLLPAEISFNHFRGEQPLPLSPGEASPCSPTSQRRGSNSVRQATEDNSTERVLALSAAMELDLCADQFTGMPVALEGFAYVSNTSGAEATEDNLLESSDLFQESSLSAGATLDPFAGTSLANLSTTLDENSVWEQMWSVIGSAPSDSIWDSQDLVRGSPSMFLLPVKPQKQSPSKMENGSGSGNHMQTRQWVAKLSHSEKRAKQCLSESSPLRVNGIDRFLRAPRPPTQRRQ